MRTVVFTLVCLMFTRETLATKARREQIGLAVEKKRSSRKLARDLNQKHYLESSREAFSHLQPRAGARFAFQALASLLLALNSAAASSIENSAALGNPWKIWKIPKNIGSHSKHRKEFVFSGHSHTDHRGGEVYSFGNYKRYYTGSSFRSRHADKRLEAVKQWFEEAALAGGGAVEQKHNASKPFNRLCILDIGCNDGQVTAEMAKAAEPDGKVLGIDMDAGLVDDARQQWCQNRADGCSSGGSEEDPACRSNLCFENINIMDVTTSLHPDASTGARVLTDFVRKAPNLQAQVAPNKCSDIADSPAGKFNIIFALSVTKWIHFHHGDLGIQEFFESIYHLLSDSESDKEQGETVNYLVLEPQPMKSYKGEKQYRRKIPSLKLRPRSFQEWLEGENKDYEDAACDREGASNLQQKEVEGNAKDDSDWRAGPKFAANGGFKLVHRINACDLEGFQRDLFIYKKRSRNCDASKSKKLK